MEALEGHSDWCVAKNEHVVFTIPTVLIKHVLPVPPHRWHICSSHRPRSLDRLLVRRMGVRLCWSKTPHSAWLEIDWRQDSSCFTWYQTTLDVMWNLHGNFLISAQCAYYLFFFFFFFAQSQISIYFSLWTLNAISQTTLPTTISCRSSSTVKTMM